MTKDSLIYISHILDSISKIKEYTQGMTEGEFLKSSLVQDAVIRNLEIIGEASKQLHPRPKREIL